MLRCLSGLLSVAAFTVVAISAAPSSSKAQGVVGEILGGDIRGRYQEAYEFPERHPDAITLVEVAGQRAVRLRLEYAWAGGQDDWFRFGEPGFAQRLQFREARGERMQAGREYWYTASFMLPSSVPRVANHSLSLMDFKHEMEVGSVPTVTFNIWDRGFVVIESLSSAWNCGFYQNANGGRSAACDRTETIAFLGSQADIANRWVQMLVHARWADDDSGFFQLWMNGRPTFGYAGNTLQGMQEVEFKFGPYRHHMNGDPGPVELYFTNVARAGSCEDLQVVDCASLTAPNAGFQNVQALESARINEFSESGSR